MPTVPAGAPDSLVSTKELREILLRYSAGKVDSLSTQRYTYTIVVLIWLEGVVYRDFTCPRQNWDIGRKRSETSGSTTLDVDDAGCQRKISSVHVTIMNFRATVQEWAAKNASRVYSHHSVFHKPIRLPRLLTGLRKS